MINKFMPDSGGIRTQFIIQGSNFGTDKDKVSVFFSDYERDRQATIVGMTNETIYCLVPKQYGGANTIKVKIVSDSSETTETFKYIVAESVSNVVGVASSGGSVDGSLADGRIQRTFGLAALNDDELISFESLSSNVRYISVNDNKISTLQTGFDGTHPAVTKDRSKIYSIGRSSPHKIYMYEKSSLWAPQIMAAQISGSTGLVFSACLDDSEEWLYFRDKNAVFGRIQISNPNNVEILNTACGNVGTSDYSYMTYSSVDDCFFVSVQSSNGIYKVSKDGSIVEEYAGFNGLGRFDGPKEEASFYSPVGMCIDKDGNLYVIDSNSNLIRKINRLSGQVSTIAGQYLVFGGANGAPLESSFNYPYCIAADDEDNFFIGESWGVTIRKLAIE
ncbi:IPT/TIG domain-containing protein [Sphingobacterium sp. LRF_L2]|uniref:IPT/TIG domain-containing protein n=1 Tax=Sphingobacterium sp. LRF_L2 TaxID=3369421 RepID=UPI003F615B51